MTRTQGWVTLSLFKYICVNLCKDTAIQITDVLKISGGLRAKLCRFESLTPRMVGGGGTVVVFLGSLLRVSPAVKPG